MLEIIKYIGENEFHFVGTIIILGVIGTLLSEIIKSIGKTIGYAKGTYKEED